MAADLSLLSSAEVAVLLAIQPQTLRKFRHTGRGPAYVRLGGPCGRVAYRRADVEAWIASRTFTSTAAEAVAAQAPPAPVRP